MKTEINDLKSKMSRLLKYAETNNVNGFNKIYFEISDILDFIENNLGEKNNQAWEQFLKLQSLQASLRVSFDYDRKEGCIQDILTMQKEIDDFQKYL